ncbi:MAG TPA: amino acid adenylation domain-containing protein, partial [Longimicrobiaceae bacterium]|nr:amino acid adenylation domain-containing protein [Longimicrobiaceae bacterium]
MDPTSTLSGKWERVEPHGGVVMDAYPLTPMQQAMLLHSQRDAGLYLQQYICTLREPLDPAEFRSAWQRLSDRHPVLRTSFALDAAPEPVQRVHASVEVPWIEYDWRGLPVDAQNDAMRAFLREDRTTPFRPGDAPLSRFALFRLEDEAYRLVWSSHHALFDGHARRVLLREVFEDYEARLNGWALAADDLRPYGDYVRWLRDAEPQDSRTFWEEELRGFESPNEVALEPGDGRREGRERHGFELSAELSAVLRRLAESKGVTLNTVLQGAWALLLGRYTGDWDVVFGATRSCRRGGFVGAGEVVGLLSNTVPVRVHLHPGRSVADLLEGLRSLWVRMRPHERTHMSRIQQWSEVSSGVQLCQTVFGFERETTQEALHLLGDAWRRRNFDLIQWTSYPLALVAHGGASITFVVGYDPARYDQEAIRRMGEHLTAILRVFAGDPQQPLGSVGILTPTERRHILDELNPAATPYPRSACVHELLRIQAARTPEAVAVAFMGEALTYGELDRRSNQLARSLHGRGVGREARVAVCMERSPELVIALLAILKAGGAYVPLDPESPRDRLRYVLEDAGASYLLCHEPLLDRLPADGPATVVADPLWAQAAGESAAPLEVPVDPRGLAYVMYTSGSTGAPKGVGVEHRSIVRLVRGASYAEFGPHEVVLQAAPVSFDASTFELWGALLHGARLVLMPGATPSLEELDRVLRRHGVTTLWLTAGLFQVMVEERLEALGGVRQLLTGGDVVPVAQVKKVRKRFPALRLINGYGPTENTTFTCCYTVPEGWSGGRLPIGTPISNTRVYVLDGALQPVPVGVPGELYAGGAGLARGYVGRPGATAERFLPDPFGSEPGARMYRTGDRVRWRSDGTLEFLGRLDAQVKVRGLRIEPGEIESVLRQYPGVGECVVVAHGDAAGERRLAAYVVGEVTVDALRRHLRESLPEYMVPATFVALDRLPLTPNGKLDRKALPLPEYGSAKERYVAPRTPVEEVLAGTWAEVLRLEGVGVEESFFELGGHSLLAMRVLSRVRELFGVELPVRALFEGSTVARLAERVEELRRAGLPGLPPVTPVERTAALPVSFPQERLWFIHRLDPRSAAYILPVCYHLEGPLHTGALRLALDAVVRRHEALRTVFCEAGGEPVQHVLPPDPFPLPVVDLTTHGDREALAIRLAGAEARRPFDLERGPLLRALLVRLDPQSHLLLAVMHHVAGDGWSLGILARELGAFYAAFASGGEPHLPELSVQYADYAAWQRATLDADRLEPALAYWRGHLAGVAPTALPADRAGPAS